MPPNFLDLLKKQVATYSFKDKPRSSPGTLARDQSIQLSPGQYDVLPPPVPKYASRNFVFRSTVQRFPTSYFTPRGGREGEREGEKHPHERKTWISCLSSIPQQGTKPTAQHEGPGPGHYNLNIPSASAVTSCFQSKVPRFLPSCSKTPGPGAYTASAQFPKQPRIIAKMGRQHSLFFDNTISF
ncbi:sperm-tail PG-rich repeat containing 4 [Phyllostomus discolor]|uniref:Sperm-tail PG-rich repeat containing 4 n=1 Tax=Phyllostomus discolor TaxID=89673 RepID=A0A834E9T7_9CHIR|nr:sperm-tail PG-rich repeat containing 4 [Phyllostomus discolor]